MFYRKEFDKKTGVYRTHDQIANFRFRITLKTLHSFVKVPKFNAEQLADAEDLDEIEFYNFRWQQKRFNDTEVERYSDVANCKTDTEKKYHQQITNDAQYARNDDEAVAARKIFSYVSDDKFNEPNDGSMTGLTQKVVKSIEWDNSMGVGNAELLPEDASEQMIQRTRFKNLNQFESMYIMANLGCEILLFTIKYRSHDGLLLVYPDFNSIDVNPYLKEIVSDSRHLYQYAIENLSTDMRSDDDWSLRADIEMMANKLSQLFIKSPMLFNLPPKRCTRVSVCFEIETAKQFEYDCIHVKYRVLAPERCDIINDDECMGSTHSSQRNSLTGDWLIGYCHELNILCHHDYRMEGGQLKILYEVVSIDGWERERTEGYATMSIPLMSGRFREKIRCYRDVGNDTWIDWLQQYFVGGRRKVRLNEFNGIGSEEDFNRAANGLNRYGNKTETTGYLSIVRNVIVQRHVETRTKSSKMNKSRSRREAKIHSLLFTYQEARERLAAITEM